MKLSLVAVVGVISLATLARAGVDWERTFNIDGPIPNAVQRAHADSGGTVFAGLSKYGSNGGSVLRFASDGMTPTTMDGGSHFALGRFGDLFQADGVNFQRRDRSSGALLWSVPAFNSQDVMTDEAGSPYLLGWNAGDLIEKRAISTGAVIWRRNVWNPIMLTGEVLLGWIPNGSMWEMVTISKKTGNIVTEFPNTMATYPLAGSGVGSEAYFYKYGLYSYGLWFYKDGAAKEVGRLFGDNLGPMIALGDGTCVVCGKTQKTRYDTVLRRLWRTPCLEGNAYLALSGGKVVEAGGAAAHCKVSVSNPATGVTESVVSTQMNFVYSVALVGNRIWAFGEGRPEARVETYDALTLAVGPEWSDHSGGAAKIEPFDAAFAGSGELLIAMNLFNEPVLARINKDGGLRWKCSLGFLNAINSLECINRLSVSPDKKFALVALGSACPSPGEPFRRYTVRVNLATGTVAESLPSYAAYVGANEYDALDGITAKKNAAALLWTAPIGTRCVIPVEDAQGNAFLIGNGRVSKVDGGTGALMWQSDSTTFQSPQNIYYSDGKVLVRDVRYIWVFDATTGGFLWKSEVGTWSFDPTWHPSRNRDLPGGIWIADAAFTYRVKFQYHSVSSTAAGFWDSLNRFYHVWDDGSTYTLYLRSADGISDSNVASVAAGYQSYAQEGKSVYMLGRNEGGAGFRIGHFTMP